MSVMVNGRAEALPEVRTLEALLAKIAPRAPYAVAHNGDFVPRDSYADCSVEPGDEIEIVHPASGG